MTKPTPTVYSYYSPEIEQTVCETMLRLNTGSRIDQSIHKLLQQNYNPGLDDLHLPLMEEYERFARSEGVIGLDTFENKWFTAGSSEGIFHLIQGLLPYEQLHQFAGEYQGYQAYANACRRSIITVSDMDDLMHSSPGIVLLSNPASIDGNIIEPQVIQEITQKHKVVLDLAYMGMTKKPLNIDLTNPNIVAVLGSLSKPFGLYYYRIGFCYSRWPIPSLYGTKWFKNALSIKIGEAVLEKTTDRKWSAFKDKYFEFQKHAVESTRWYMRAPKDWIAPSDVWLLAHSHIPTETWGGPGYAEFKRTDDTLRFCLTPYYMERRDA